MAPLLQHHVDKLRPKWREVSDAFRAFVPQFLEFAVAYRDAYVEVLKLGPEAVKRLNLEIELSDAAASRLRDIADANTRLLPHVKVLPASFDALHAIAVLATDEPKIFQRAIDKGTISSSLTVRDARQLQPKRRAGNPNKTQTPLTVTLTFDTSVRLAETIAGLLSASIQAKVSNPKLRDDIKEKIGKHKWASVQHYLYS